VTDHDLGALDAVKETADGRAVELQIDQRVRCGTDGVAVVAQPSMTAANPDASANAPCTSTIVGLAGVGRASAVAAKANEARETVASATVASAPGRWRRERMGMVLVLLGS
jgi:hypothetical protein